MELIKMFTRLRLSLLLLVITCYSHAEPYADAYNHVVYSFALIKQGVNPSSVRTQFTQNIALEKVPKEFLPLYKKFLGMIDELQINYDNIHKHENALAEQSKQLQSQKLMSVVKNGALVADILGGGGTITTGITFLSKFVAKGGGSTNLVSAESLSNYQANNSKLLTDFEFDIRLAKGMAKSSSAMTLSDAELFVTLEKEYQESNYSKFLELDARIKNFYPIKYNLARLEMLNKNYKGSYERFLEALGSLSQVTNNSDIKKDLLQNLIITGIQTKVPNNIILQHTAELEAIAPNDSYVHFVNGVVSLENKDLDKGKALLSKAAELSDESAFIPLMVFGIQCKLEAYSDCYKSLVKIKELAPEMIEPIRAGEAADSLKVGSPDLYSKVFGISLEWSMEWHLLNYDRLIITNKSPFTWVNVVIGNTMKEVHADQAFRPFQDYWFSYGNIESGQSVAVNVGKTTKTALEYIDVQLKTDQGNNFFRLERAANGEFIARPMSE